MPKIPGIAENANKETCRLQQAIQGMQNRGERERLRLRVLRALLKI